MDRFFHNLKTLLINMYISGHLAVQDGKSVMTRNYDLVVLGAGPAGESAAELAAFFGHSVVIVEKNKPGGVVTTTGGAPTKTLRESMLALTGFHNREVYGITVSAPPQLAVEKIAERTRHVAELLQDVTAQNIARNGVEYMQGTAKVDSDRRRVLVTSPGGEHHELLAKNILVATGSRPFHPDNIPFEDPDVWDSDEFFSPGRQLPKSIFIAGGGPVGVEFATFFAGLGVPTTISDSADRLIHIMDTEMSDLIEKHLKRIGVDVILGSTTRAIRRVNRSLEVTLTNGRSFQPDAVLFAAGRRVNTDGLGLEEAGVELDDRGRIKVDHDYKTTADGIYAAGDVLGPSLASVAMEQGRIAACRIFDIKLKGTVDPTPVSAVYSMPEVAGVGLTEEQCRSQGLDYVVGRSDLSLIPRGAIAGHGGILKLIFNEKDRRLLGVHCFGDIASELVGIGQMVIHFNGTINTFLEVTLNTPTYTYAYKYAAVDGIRKLGNFKHKH
jgi:NAD(P) transhydrogenase